MLIVVGAVLAGDAGALTGFTVALCNKLRRMDAEPQRAPSDAHLIQRVHAWPATTGEPYRRLNRRPVGSGTVRESHAKAVELSSRSIAQVTEALLTEFQERVPIITIVATVRQSCRDLARIAGRRALPAEVEVSARHRLTELTKQTPLA
jgi:hypothetical protein